jgi:hypothetical protein
MKEKPEKWETVEYQDRSVVFVTLKFPIKTPPDSRPIINALKEKGFKKVTRTGMVGNTWTFRCEKALGRKRKVIIESIGLVGDIKNKFREHIFLGKHNEGFGISVNKTTSNKGQG